MRKNAAVFLIGLISIGLAVGCAGGNSSKRARIATITPKVSAENAPQAADTENNGDNTDDASAAPAPETVTPPPTAGADEQVTTDQGASESLLNAFMSMKLDGESVDIADLKGLTLDLDEIIVLYNRTEGSSYTALSSYKVRKNVNGSFDITSNGEMAFTGTSQDAQLLVLDVLDHVAFNAQGVMQLGKSHNLTLAPEIQNNKLVLNKELLANGAAGTGKRTVLERLFDDIFYLPADELEGEDSAFKISSTGVLIHTKIVKTTEALDILVEANGEEGSQSFLLKFRLSADTPGLAN